MSYDEDPTRWTSSPDDAPELLRGAFTAARDEGPSRMQMRSLALKIAAASAGGAIAVGTVKAASAGQAMATAATWSVGKIAAVVALAGTLVTGGALVWHANTRTSEPPDQKRGAAAPAPQGAANAAATELAPSAAGTRFEGASESAQAGAAVEARGSAREQNLERDMPVVQEPGAASSSAREREPVSAHAPEGALRPPRPSAAASTKSLAANVGASTTLSARGKSPLARPRARFDASAKAAHEKPALSVLPQHARTEASASLAKTSSAAAKSSVKTNAPESEITLLRRAQLALQARPREAFQLTQEHRRLYPDGEFAQERDALAIQALMRVGDSENARALATSFIRAYPSSPHAHRFREAMGLR